LLDRAFFSQAIIAEKSYNQLAKFSQSLSTMGRSPEFVEVLIIGAGPAGAVAAALLRRRGRQVLMLERETFPRFSIGESLLPQSMEYLEQAGMLRAVEEGGFQLKDGAAFGRGEQYTQFDFGEKHSAGWSTTYQVQRARFDHLLAREAERKGAEVRYRHEVIAVDFGGDRPRVNVKDQDGETYLIEVGFILDGSGFGRVLPRLLQLETPSNFPVRGAIFTHIEDHVSAENFDRNKILITVHPVHNDLWYWLIPFADGRSSLGVVGKTDDLIQTPGSDTEKLQSLVQQAPSLHRLLARARWDTPARKLIGYSANVKSLCGPGYALLGNAGEFLDPIFSSGVTIAFKSSSLAATALERQFRGEKVDWQAEFAAPLKRGIDTFRAFVESWYRGGFQRIIFFAKPPADIRRMISAILAGYAWDETNPYVRDTQRRLAALEELCCER
jgi:flavin-dependent dehydrogenase